jgi:hypothetical protein
MKRLILCSIAGISSFLFIMGMAIRSCEVSPFEEFFLCLLLVIAINTTFMVHFEDW